MKKYYVTLINAAGRESRIVIALNSMRAASIALDMMPESDGPFTVICKPCVH